MAGRVKTYGPAPEPADPKELFLAKMLQNALARGVAWCKGSFWIDDTGRTTGVHADAVACCALGAAYFERDTTEIGHSTFGVICGNDYDTGEWLGSSDSVVTESDHEDVGYAFREAMTRE